MSYKSELSFVRAQRQYDAQAPGDDNGFSDDMDAYIEMNAVCPNCKGENTRHVEDETFDCSDCDEHYYGYGGRRPKRKSEYLDERAEYLADLARDEGERRTMRVSDCCGSEDRMAGSKGPDYSELGI